MKIKEEGLEGLADLVSYSSGQLRDEREDGDDPDYQVKVTKTFCFNTRLGMIDLFLFSFFFNHFLFLCTELCIFVIKLLRSYEIANTSLDEACNRGHRQKTRKTTNGILLHSFP